MKTTTFTPLKHAPHDSTEKTMNDKTNETPVKTNGQADAKTSMTGADLVRIFESVTASLDDVEASLGSTPPDLTAVHKRRAAKPRKGATPMLLALAEVVQQHGLDSSALSADRMVSRLGDAATLRPLQSRLEAILKRVEDELFNAQGEAWELGLQFYSLVKRRAKTDGELAANIEPMRSLFAYRHGLTKKERPTKVQTRAKARLESALSLAAKHEIAPNGESHPAETNDEPAVKTKVTE
jgi:hypothetical protein